LFCGVSNRSTRALVTPSALPEKRSRGEYLLKLLICTKCRQKISGKRIQFQRFERHSRDKQEHSINPIMMLDMEPMIPTSKEEQQLVLPMPFQQ